MKTYNIYGKCGNNGEMTLLATKISKENVIKEANNFYNQGYKSVIIL
jgi:hypothetical protein